MRKFSPKRLIAGFKDPVTRPRFIIWAAVVVMILVMLMVVALGASSNRWFCRNACHHVQDDLLAAYDHGPHSQISCLACHEPADGSPVTFMLLKVKALGELYMAIAGTFHFPINPGSALSQNKQEMPATQCTQCHSANRPVSPVKGFIMNHKVHLDKGYWCTVCHNRAAHPEDGITLHLKAPDGSVNTKHANFLDMEGCFRCHDLAGKKIAPGVCKTCHKPGWQFKPDDHMAADYAMKGHAAAASQAATDYAEAQKLAAENIAEGMPKRLATPVNYCFMCHIKEEFCVGCHGMQVSHMADLANKTHPVVAKQQFDKCVLCHGDPFKTSFCFNCHHGTQIGWKFDKTIPWIKQHGSAVKAAGKSDGCFKGCHKPDFCYTCHPKIKPYAPVNP